MPCCLLKNVSHSHELRSNWNWILFHLDDMLIKLWDWDKKWLCSQVFEGHTHYVMQIVINPKDNNQFASASLDRTIKVMWLRKQSHGVDRGMLIKTTKR